MHGNNKAFSVLMLLMTISSIAIADISAFAYGGDTPASFSEASDRRAERLLAQSVGDECIASGTEAVFARYSKEDVDQYIDRMILQTGSTVGEERAEANQQIHRLWRLCVPKLVETLGHVNETINEAAMKNLILMRNEEVVEQIIERAKSSTDPRVRYSCVFALGKMREDRASLIPNRKVLDATASEAIVESRIRPFLDQLEETTEDPAMRQLVSGARKSLAQPPSPRSSPGKRQAE